MNDDINEALSAFMDDEAPEAHRLAERLSRDPDLQARWSRYHLIRDAMTEHLTYAELDIASRVSEALEKEPTVLAPRRWHLTPRARKVARQVAGLAIAATVSAVTVITVQQQRVENGAPTVAQAASGNSRIAQASPSRPAPRIVQFVPENRQLEPAVRSKLSNYLVNHSEYSVTSNMQGMLPFMRIVSANHPGDTLPAPRPPARIENAVVNGQ